MISANLRFEGFDARSWTNLISLFAPGVVARMTTEIVDDDAPEMTEPAAFERRSGMLVVVVDEDDRVLKAFHTVRGRIKGLSYAGPDHLEAMCERYGARRCFVLREGVLEEISERAARRLDRSDDYVAQLLTVARAVREMSDAGAFLSWPRPLATVPIPTGAMVARALDTVFPDNRAMVSVLWKRGVPWTGLVMRRRGGLIDLIAGPDLIARWSGPLGGDWRRDYRVITAAVDRAVAPVHLGLFGEVTTLRSVLRSAEPGAWARAVAVRDLIAHPMPPYVAVALGADVVRAMAQRSARWLGGIDAVALMGPYVNYMRGRIAEVASVTATLGFDPLKLLAGWLQRSDEGAEGLSEMPPPEGPPHPASLSERSPSDRASD